MSISGKHIWICPLNWGLGHASRCIPLIRALQAEQASIYLASDGDALDLLNKEFPELPHFILPGYGIRYGRRSAIGGLMWRLPGIFKAISQEQTVLTDLMRQHPCDLIISDNRYGAWSASHPSVIITHQLSLPLAAPAKALSKRMLNHWFAPFREIWIPDWAGTTALAGDLSQVADQKPKRHLGILSRMLPGKRDIRYQILVVLSGPEPQRSKLESLLLDQLQTWPGRCCLVRGTKSAADLGSLPDHVDCIDLADTTQLNELMQQAELVVCRTGYSSLMDLVQLEKSALVIPTPGQPEQEYLAEYHKGKDWWLVQRQDAVDLKAAWAQRGNLVAPSNRKMEIWRWIAACEEILNC